MDKSYIVYDGRKVAAYNLAADFCKSRGWDDKFLSDLWEGILQKPLLYDEFVYYLEKNELTGNFNCHGYTMPDLYFYHLRCYNAGHDVGKDSDVNNKDEIVFMAFHTMGRLQKEPDAYIAMLEKYSGMDIL